MDIESNFQGEVICTFTTKLEDSFKIPSNQLSLQTNMSSADLSNLVISILQSQYPEIDYKDEQFDFLIEGEMLRSSIQEFLKIKNISNEKSLNIEYVRKLNQPELQQIKDVEDWIIKIFHNQMIQDQTLIGLANSQLKVINKKKEESLILDQYQSARTYEIGNNNGVPYLLTALLNQTILVNLLQHGNKKTQTQQVGQIQLDNTVESLAVSETNHSQFCSGQGNGTLNIFDLNKHAEDAQDKIKKIQPVKTFELHKQMISSCIWADDNILTGSYDHQIHSFNLAKEKTQQQYYSKNSVITCLEMNKLNNILMSGHDDFCIKHWDLRQQQPIQSLYQGYSSVTSLSISKSNPYLYASGQFEGTVNIWDQRATLPLYSIKHPETKILDVVITENQILCGGSDCKLKIYKL